MPIKKTTTTLKNVSVKQVSVIHTSLWIHSFETEHGYQIQT